MHTRESPHQAGFRGPQTLQRDDFAELPIPLPPLAEQQPIATLAALMAGERALLRRLATATARKHEALGRALLARGNHNQDPRHP